MYLGDLANHILADIILVLSKRVSQFSKKKGHKGKAQTIADGSNSTNEHKKFISSVSKAEELYKGNRIGRMLLVVVVVVVGNINISGVVLMILGGG